MFALLFALPLLVSAAVHDVQVGKDGFAFTPEALSANVGDQVVFHFVAKNHTATQSSFANPCGPMNGGFDSGFMPVAPNATDFPSFSYTVTGTDPVWVYCKQASGTPASHCGAGMVFSINCPTNSDAKNSFNNFKASALAIGQQLQAQATSSSADSGYGGAYGGSSAASSVASAPEASATSSTPVTASSTSGPGQVHEVIVGGNATLTFEPSHITAAQNDVISFKFVSKNHTATQSTFASPCRKVESTSTTQQVGFDSGFMFVGNSTTPLVWNVTVNDTNPIWVYCRQATPVDHCGAGMVFAVNSDESSSSQKTFSIFQAAAKSQNGTSTGTGTTGSSGGAMPNRVGAALATIVVGVIGVLLV